MTFSKRELWALALLICASLVTSAWLMGSRPVAIDVDRTAHGNETTTAEFVAVRKVTAQGPYRLRQQLAHAWGSLAWVIEREDQIRTTGQLRAVIARYEQLLFARTELAGAFPGFSSAANNLLVTRMGTDDQLLQRPHAVAALQELARACDPFYQEELP